MKRFFLTFVLLILALGILYWLKFFRRDNEDGIQRVLEAWKIGNFEGYRNAVINREKFEEMLFLNSLLGRKTLNCTLNLDTLHCEGFLPIPVKVFPSSIEILGKIYLSEDPKDWESKLKNRTYYEALQLCAGQLREKSKVDSLYLEKTCAEGDIKFWKSVSDRKANAKFLEFLLRRKGFGYVCLDKNTFIRGEMIFSKAVSSPKVDISEISKREIRVLEARLKELEGKLELAVNSSIDPLAEAFYKRGLEYFAKGDYKNAEIFFARALKVDPKHEKAKEALARVRRALGK